MSIERWRRVGGGCVLGLLPLLAGCFEFERPLGPPEKGAIDQALLGMWSCQSQDPKEKDRFGLRFLAFDTTQYVVQFSGEREQKAGPAEAAEEEVGFYRAYSTRVGTQTLLNAQELKASGPHDKWTYVRYRLGPGRLAISIVDDTEIGGTGEAATRAVRKRVGDEKIYTGLMTCTREGGGQ